MGQNADFFAQKGHLPILAEEGVLFELELIGSSLLRMNVC